MRDFLRCCAGAFSPLQWAVIVAAYIFALCVLGWTYNNYRLACASADKSETTNK